MLKLTGHFFVFPQRQHRIECWRKAEDCVGVVRAKYGLDLDTCCCQQRGSRLWSGSEGTNIVKKSEQVEKLLGGVRSAHMVHAMEISPQAPKDMLSSIGGFWERCRVGEGKPTGDIRLGAIKGLSLIHI